MDYKSLGLISIAIMWLGLFFLVYKWRGEPHMSFSLHAAANRKAYLFYLGLFVITLPLFFVFVVKWFVPTLNLPRTFIYLVIAAMVFQFVAALVPEVEGKRARIHRFSAGIVTFLLIPMTFMLVNAKHIPLSIRALAMAAALFMVIVWGLYVWIESFNKHFLYFQAAYVAVFHLTILACTYLRGIYG